MADVRFLLAQIIAFVIGAAVLGLVVGWLLGRATGRFASVRFDRARDEEFVLVRPDNRLFDENERLRDQNSVLEGKLNRLRTRSAQVEADLRVAQAQCETAQLDAAQARAELANAVVADAEELDASRPDTLVPEEVEAVAPELEDAASATFVSPGPFVEVAPDPSANGSVNSRLPGVSAVHAARLADAHIHDIAALAELDTAGLTRVAHESGIPVWRLHLWRVAGRAKRRQK